MRIIIILCLLTFSFATSAQVQTSKTYETYEEQYKFSKRKANKLLIIGGSSIVTGTILAVIPSQNAYAGVGKILGSVSLISAGIVVGLVSIPFYITAGSNKRKMKILQPELSTMRINGTNYTNIGVKMRF